MKHEEKGAHYLKVKLMYLGGRPWNMKSRGPFGGHCSWPIVQDQGAWPQSENRGSSTVCLGHLKNVAGHLTLYVQNYQKYSLRIFRETGFGIGFAAASWRWIWLLSVSVFFGR